MARRPVSPIDDAEEEKSYARSPMHDEPTSVEEPEPDRAGAFCEELVLDENRASLKGVAWSRDGRWLASGDVMGAVHLVHMDTRECRVLEGHEDGVLCCSFSVDGAQLASGSEDSSVMVWDVASGTSISYLRHEDHTNDVAFSPNGQWLAAGCDDSTVTIYAVGTWEEFACLQGHVQGVRSLAWTPEGRLVSSCCGGEIRVWTVTSGACAVVTGRGEPVNDLSICPHGGLLASVTDESLQVWDLDSFSELLQVGIPENHPSSVDFHSNGRMLAVGSFDGAVEFKDASTGMRVGRLHPTGDSSVARIAYGPDGCLAVSGADGSVRVYRMDNPTLQVNTMEAGSTGNAAPVRAIAFIEEHGCLVSCDGAGVSAWDPESGRQLNFIPHPGIRTMALGPTSCPGLTAGLAPWAAVCSKSGVQAINVATGVTTTLMQPKEHGLAMATAVAFSPSGLWLAVGSSDGTVFLRDMRNGQVRILEGHTSTVMCCAFSCVQGKQQMLATSSMDKTIRLMDLSTWEKYTLQADSSRAARRVTFSPSGTHLVTCPIGPVARIWNIATGSWDARLVPSQGDGGEVLDAVYSPDSSTLATSHEDGTVCVWDAGTGRERAYVLRASEDRVRTLCFSPDGRFLATGCAAGRVKLWDATALAQPETPLCALVDAYRTDMASGTKKDRMLFPRTMKIVTDNPGLAMREVWWGWPKPPTGDHHGGSGGGVDGKKKNDKKGLEGDGDPSVEDSKTKDPPSVEPSPGPVPPRGLGLKSRQSMHRQSMRDVYKGTPQAGKFFSAHDGAPPWNLVVEAISQNRAILITQLLHPDNIPAEVQRAYVLRHNAIARQLVDQLQLLQFRPGADGGADAEGDGDAGGGGGGGGEGGRGRGRGHGMLTALGVAVARENGHALRAILPILTSAWYHQEEMPEQQQLPHPLELLPLGELVLATQAYSADMFEFWAGLSLVPQYSGVQTSEREHEHMEPWDIQAAMSHTRSPVGFWDGDRKAQKLTGAMGHVFSAVRLLLRRRKPSRKVNALVLPIPDLSTLAFMRAVAEAAEAHGTALIFKSEVVVAVVEHQWRLSSHIYYRHFLLYLLFLATVALGEGATGILLLARVVLLIYFIYREAVQAFHGDLLGYITDPWNLIDNGAHALVGYSAVAELFDFPEIRLVYALAVALLWFKVLFFLRAFRSTGPLVGMIFKIIGDIKIFLLVLAIVVLAFTNAFWFMYHGEMENYSIFEELLRVYAAIFGGFETEDFEDSINPTGTALIWAAFMFLVVIILLNILIAVVSDNYSSVMHMSEPRFRLEQANLMLEISLFENPSERRMRKNLGRWLQVLRPVNWMPSAQERKQLSAESRMIHRLAALEEFLHTRHTTGQHQRKALEGSFERLESEMLDAIMRLDSKLATLSNDALNSTK